MFENFTSKMSRMAAQSVKETVMESIEPAMKVGMALAPMIGLLLASSLRSRASKHMMEIMFARF